MGISDWSSDVCSSDLIRACATIPLHVIVAQARIGKSLLAADDVRKLHRVAHEEDRRVVADQIVVALVGVELQREIGREACRERVGQYVLTSVVAGSLEKTITLTLQSRVVYDNH